jgi:anaerobic selenocysteine-containing dehydrogenase
VAGLAATLGRGAMSNPLRDMEQPDVIFCIGTNMTETHPVAATRLKKAMRKGAKLIVADPRRFPLADMADVYLPLRVGTDVALLGAMAHVIVREGLVDEAFVAERTENIEALREHVGKFTPESAEGITGVPAADIERAAIWYGKAERGAIYYTLGITEHICGVDNVQSLCNLALMTGNLGIEGAGLNPLRGQNNVQGSGDAGRAAFVPVGRGSTRGGGGTCQRANNWPRSRNDLNSSALPDGSRKNMVACSPTWPAKRTYGSITKRMPPARSRSASAWKSSQSSTTPKCGTGTS